MLDAVATSVQRDFEDLGLCDCGTPCGAHGGEAHVATGVASRVPAQAVGDCKTGAAWGAGRALVKWILPEMRTCVLGKELGKGSTGVVFRASLGDGGSPVAVKVLRAAKGHAELEHERLEDLRREMLIAVQLPWHENIPMFVGVARIDSDCPQAVWELVDGQTIEQLLACSSGQSLSALTRLGWCRQLFSALACLHDHHMVHRDIKPANVMVTKDLSTLKLVDFGLCKRIADDEVRCPAMTGQTGSFRYMAPEVMLESAYACKVDIYSAAMCVYHMVTGAAPFTNLAGEQVAELAARTRLRPVLDGKGFENPRVGALLDRAWAHDPADRPDAHTCVQDCELIIADETARPRQARSMSPVRNFRRFCSVIREHVNGSSSPRLSPMRRNDAPNKLSSPMPEGGGGKTDSESSARSKPSRMGLSPVNFVRAHFQRRGSLPASFLLRASSPAAGLEGTSPTDGLASPGATPADVDADSNTSEAGSDTTDPVR